MEVAEADDEVAVKVEELDADDDTDAEEEALAFELVEEAELAEEVVEAAATAGRTPLSTTLSAYP